MKPTFALLILTLASCLPAQSVSCTGTISAPTAPLPFGQGAAHLEKNPAAIAQDQILQGFSGTTMVAFAPCSGAPGSAIAVNTGPCSGVSAVNAGWAPAGISYGSVTPGGPFARDLTANGPPGVCGGTIDYPLATSSVGGGGPLQTEINPTQLSLIPPFGPSQCRTTLGRILGVIGTQQSGIGETVLFTSRPAIEVLAAGTLNSLVLPGTQMRAGIVVQQGNLTYSNAITDTHLCSVAGATVNSYAFPAGKLPVSAAGIGSCSSSGATAFTMAVQTDEPGILVVAGGQSVNFTFPSAILAPPIAFTNGAWSGILAFTLNEYHVIQGGVRTSYSLVGTFVSYLLVPEGVAVTTSNSTRCFLTAGTIHGAVTTKVGSLTSVALFTDKPSIDVLSNNVIDSVELPGIKMFAGGTFGHAGFSTASAANVAITDVGVSIVSGGSVTNTAWPAGCLPRTAAGIATCVGGYTHTIAVETTQPGIFVVGGGASTNFTLSSPPVVPPYSYSNGISSGVLVIRQNAYDQITGGTKTTTALPGNFVAVVPNGFGLLVTTTGTPSTTQIYSLAPAMIPFAVCDGRDGSSISFNMSNCNLDVGISAGWPSPGLHVRSPNGMQPVLATTTPGGPWIGFTLDIASTDSYDRYFRLHHIPSGTTRGLTVFSTLALGFPGGGPILGLTPSQETTTLINFAIATPPAPGNPVNWIPGVVGLWPETAFVLPGAPFTPLAGLSWDFLALALDAGFNVLDYTNVARVTW